MDSDIIFKRRHDKIREKISEDGIDAALISSSTNIYYFTNFNPMFHNHIIYFIIFKDKEPIFILDHIREIHAQQDSWVKNLLLYAPPGTGKPGMERDPISATKRVLGNTKILGIEEGSMRVNSYRMLRSNFESIEFRDITPHIQEMRKCKDEYEIQCVRNAAEISNVGMKKVLELAKSRVDEMTICIEAEYIMANEWKKRFPDMDTASPVGGPDGTIMRALWCLCPSGPRALHLTDTPTNRKLRGGDLALPRIWTNCNGYVAENERSIIVGEPTNEQRKIYHIVMEARKKFLSNIRPGITCGKVFDTAKSVFEEVGYGDLLKHMVGHALGLEWHENPNFLKDDETKLEVGMVMTVEPKVYIEGFQYGHSDTMVVTEDGYDLLTDFSNISEEGIVVV